MDDSEMKEISPNATNQIVCEKSFGTPQTFEMNSKHVKPEHVEENMKEALIGVHKHMRHYLPWFEKRRFEIKPGKMSVHKFGHDQCRNEKEDIDYD